MLLFVAPTAHAVSITATSNGTWDDTATWLPAQVPVVGDAVFITGSRLVTVPVGGAAFGQSGVASEWSSTVNPFLRLASGNLVHTNGSVLNWTSASGTPIISLTTPNDFINMGIFSNRATVSTKYMDQSANAFLINEGTFDVSGGGNWSIRNTGGGISNLVGALFSSSGSGMTLSGDLTDKEFVNLGTVRADDSSTLRINMSYRGTGEIQATNDGIVMFQDSTLPNGGSIFSSQTIFRTGGGGQIRLGGEFTSIEGRIMGTSNVVLYSGSWLGDGSPSYIDVDGGSHGLPELDIEGHNGIPNVFGGGNDILEFRSPIRHNGKQGYNGATGSGWIRNVVGNRWVMQSNTWYLRNTGGIENQGLIEVRDQHLFNHDGGSGGALSNLAGAVFVLTSGTGSYSSNNDNKYFYNAGLLLADNGSTFNIAGAFQDAGGTLAASNNAIVKFTGTTRERSWRTNSIFRTGSGGQIRLGGKIDALTGLASGTSNTLLHGSWVAGSTLSYIDFSSGSLGNDFLEWPGFNSSHTIASGRVMEFRSKIRHNGAGGYNLFSSPGTLRIVSNNTFYATNNRIYVRGGLTIENLGTIEMQGNGFNFYMDSSSGLLTNAPGATLLALNSGNSVFGTAVNRFFKNEGTIRADNNGLLAVIANYHSDAGSMIASNNGTIQFTLSSHLATNVFGTNTTYATGDGGRIMLGGRFTRIGGTYVGDPSDAKIVLEETRASMPTSYIQVVGTDLIWSNVTAGGANFLLNQKRVEVHNNILFNPKQSAGHQYITGASSAPRGTWVLAEGKTFTHQSASQVYIMTGATVENRGTFRFRAASGSQNIAFIGSHGETFNNLGTIEITNGTAGFISASANDTFDNQGALLMSSSQGIFNVDVDLDVPQYVSGSQSLTGGTWQIKGELNLDPANNLIHTIDTDAVVRMVTRYADWEELKVSTVNGTFGCYDRYVLDTNTITIAGTYEVRIADPDAHDTLVRTGITLETTPTLTGGSVDVVDGGLTNGGLFTIMTWSGGDAADMSLGNTPNNGLLYFIFNSPSNVQLNVTLPPQGMTLVFE